MAKTSVHFQPCKEISEIHNYRKKKLDYVRTQLTNKNENWMWDSSKSLADRREEIRKLVKEKTGRKMQSKAVPLHEAVVVIDENTTMDDLKKLGKIYQQRFGIECIHISIHRDEGHWVDKHESDIGLKPTDTPTQEQINKGVTWKPNLHAHMVFDWYNHDNGKSWKTSKQDARDMQTIAAEVLSMGRGQESTKKHLDGLSYKISQKLEEAAEAEDYLRDLKQSVEYSKNTIEFNQNYLDEIEGKRDKALQQAEELKEQLRLKSDWLKEQQVRTEEVKQSLAKELKQLENTKTAIETNYCEIARQKQQMEELKLYLAKANNRIETNSYAYDELEEFELDEMIGYLKEDIDDAKQEALNAKKILSERKKELEKTNLRISDGLDSLSGITAEVNKQKAVREQINTQIEEFTGKLQNQQKEYDEKALKIAHFNAVLENYKEQQSILYEVARQKISVFGISAYELLANTAGELQQIYKKKAEQLQNNVNDAISRIVDFSHNAAKKGFSQEDYMVFDSILGKENRESKARFLIERAEKKIGFSSYMGKNIVHRDIMDFARDNKVSLRTERGRGIGY